MAETNVHQSTGEKIASHIPGTEASKERKMVQETGSGTGNGQFKGAGVDYTQPGGGPCHACAPGVKGIGLAAPEPGDLVGEPTPGRLGEHDHNGTGHHHTSTGNHHTGTGHHTLTDNGTLTGNGTHQTSGGEAWVAHSQPRTGKGVADDIADDTANDTADDEHKKEGLGTKIKKMIPGTEEHKLKKEGLL